MADASAIAADLLNPNKPNTERLAALRDIKNTNPLLHSAVTSQMDQMRSRARSVGQNLVLGQQAAAPAG
jgi:hypothetical protein